MDFALGGEDGDVGSSFVSYNFAANQRVRAPAGIEGVGRGFKSREREGGGNVVN
jgi:hypothetical protein